jgi:predicted metal-dependent peptidase
MAAAPFFGFLVLRLRPRLAVPEDHVDTAGIAPSDGTLVLNSDFLRSLSDAEVIGLLVHELMHACLDHGDRCGERDSFLFNVAADFAANAIIVNAGEDDFQLPDGSLIEPAFENLSAEEIYEHVIRFPRHKVLGGALKGDLRNDLAETDEGRAARAGSAVAARRLREGWKLSVQQAAELHARSGRGRLPAGLRRIVDDLVEPKLDWREQLGRVIGEFGRRNEHSYRRPSRRSESAGEILPSLMRSANEVAVVVDTSSSIDQTRLTEALSEVQALIDDLGISVRLLVVDAEVHADLVIADTLELLEKCRGGGGSDLRPAFRRLDEDRFAGPCCVVFTDGDVAVPEAAPELFRVLWILDEHDEKVPASWGEVVRVPASRTPRRS